MKGKKTETEEATETPVSLTIKVPETDRRHWTAQAKSQGTTIRAAVIDCLTKRFGKPKPPSKP